MRKSLNFNRKIHNLGLGNNVSRPLSNGRIFSATARGTDRKAASTGMSTRLVKMNNMDKKKKLNIFNNVDADHFRTEAEFLNYLASSIRPFQSLGTHPCEPSAPPALEGSEWVDYTESLDTSDGQVIDKELESEKLEGEKLERERLERERLEREKLEREKLERERLEREKLEIYLFSFCDATVLPYVVGRYRAIYPTATIHILDNNSIDVSVRDSLGDCVWTAYGGEDDFDYDEQDKLYRTAWRDCGSDKAWVLLAPADTVVFVTPETIRRANDTGVRRLGISNFDIVGKSTKKDLSDMSLKDLRVVCDGPSLPVACFSKDLMPDTGIDYTSNTIVTAPDTADTIRCNAYTYKYLGLSYYVSLSRSRHGRQARWRKEGYKCCSRDRIDEISNEILSLGQTRLLEKLE